MLIVGRRRHGPAAELGLTLMRLARTRAWTLRPRLPASGPAAELSYVLVHSAPDSALPTPEGVCLPSRSVPLALAVCNDWFIVMSLIVSPCGAQPMLNPAPAVVANGLVVALPPVTPRGQTTVYAGTSYGVTAPNPKTKFHVHACHIIVPWSVPSGAARESSGPGR